MMVMTTRALRSSRGEAQEEVAIDQGQVGLHAGLGACQSALREGGMRGAGGKASEEIFHRELLLGMPAAGGLAFGVLPSQAGIEAPEGADDLDGEVAAEGQRRPGVDEPTPGVGPLHAVGAESGIRPPLVGAGVEGCIEAMIPSLANRADVGLADDLGVLDPEPRVAGLRHGLQRARRSVQYRALPRSPMA